jgi:hypothetical protein
MNLKREDIRKRDKRVYDMKMGREDVRKGRWKGFGKEDEKGKTWWKDERERGRGKEREIEDVRKWE